MFAEISGERLVGSEHGEIKIRLTKDDARGLRIEMERTTEVMAVRRRTRRAGIRESHFRRDDVDARQFTARLQDRRESIALGGRLTGTKRGMGLRQCDLAFMKLELHRFAEHTTISLHTP